MSTRLSGPPSRTGVASIAYATAIALMLLKVALVIAGVELRAGPWSHGWLMAIYAAGKVVPTLICAAFLVDAVTRPRSKRMQVFWSAMLAGIPLFTVAFVLWQDGRI
jgi:hypothetical protein